MVKVEVKVCEITYIQRGGETVVVQVDPHNVERQASGGIVFRKWDPEIGFVSVWVSARYLLDVQYKTVLKTSGGSND